MFIRAKVSIINLGGNSDNKLQLNISAAQARFIEINKYFNSKANDAVQVFSQEYPKAIKNLDNAIQKTYDLGLEYNTPRKLDQKIVANKIE